MAINFFDNLSIGTGKPLDDRYLNGTTPYATIAAANAAIIPSRRHVGLRVLIGASAATAVEHAYQGGTLDTDLVQATTLSAAAATKLDGIEAGAQVNVPVLTLPTGDPNGAGYEYSTISGTLAKSGTPVVFPTLLLTGTSAGRPSYKDTPGEETGRYFLYWSATPAKWNLIDTGISGAVWSSTENVATPDLVTAWAAGSGGLTGSPAVSITPAITALTGTTHGQLLQVLDTQAWYKWDANTSEWLPELAGGDLTSGPVTSSGGVSTLVPSAIPDASIPVAKITGLGTAATTDASAAGLAMLTAPTPAAQRALLGLSAITDLYADDQEAEEAGVSIGAIYRKPDGVTGWLQSGPDFTLGRSYSPTGGDLCTVPVYPAANAALCKAGHPSVVYIAAGVSGYNYWMAMTPLKPNEDDFENPSIVASHDGVTWEVPPGVTNPLVPMPETGWNADTNLTWEGDRFVLIYTLWGLGGYNTFGMTSPDGITWSSPFLMRFTLTPTAVNASPSLRKKPDGTYQMWSVNTAASPYKVQLSTSPSLTGPWTTVDCSTTPEIATPWHLEVAHYEGRFLMLMDAQDSFGRHSLVWLESMDGISWSIPSKYPYAIAFNGNAAGTSTYYKSTFVLGRRFGTGNVGRMWHTNGSFSVMRVTDIPALTIGDLSENHVADAVPLAVAITAPYVIGDNFVRANGELHNVTAPSGQTWIKYVGAILNDNNQLRQGTGNCIASITHGSNDGIVGCRFAVMPYDAEWAIQCRSQRNLNLNRVELYYQGKVFTLRIYNGSAFVNYAAWYPPVVSGGSMAGYEITMEFRGRDITARINGRTAAKVTLSESDAATVATHTQVSLNMLDPNTRIDRFFTQN